MDGHSYDPRPVLRTQKGYTVITWIPNSEQPPQLSPRDLAEINYQLNQERSIYLIPADSPNIILQGRHSPDFLVEHILKRSLISEIGVEGIDKKAEEIVYELYCILGSEEIPEEAAYPAARENFPDSPER